MTELLPETEQKILEYLVGRGDATAGRIAQVTGVKRPTVYAALKNLGEWGLVSKHRVAGVTEFHALEPKHISKVMVERAERNLVSIRKEAALLEERLTHIGEEQPRDIAGYEIVALQSREAVQLNLEEALLRGHYSAFFNPQVVLTGEVKQIVARFLKASAKNSPPIRELCVAGPLTDWYVQNIRNKNHQVRLLPEHAPISSDMICIDGSVILSHYGTRSELAIRITQQNFYDSMMALFEIIWSSAKKVC